MVFTIHYTIRSFIFARDLCDLGDSTNLMSLVEYKKLGMGSPKPTSMKIMMKDHIMKKLVGILYGVLAKVDFFILPANFMFLIMRLIFTSLLS